MRFTDLIIKKRDGHALTTFGLNLMFKMKCLIIRSVHF